MKQTYPEAIAQVFKDEGGYTNDPADAGGPTNFGITIIDARKYWKSDATASDVKSMPKSVAQDIYRQQYANAVNYDNLPPGVDYAVLDYGVNSGVNRSNRIYNKVKTDSPIATINAIYDEREAFLNGLAKSKPSQQRFLKGWLTRTGNGRKLALSLYDKYHTVGTISTAHAGAGGAAAGGAVVVASNPHLWPYVVGVLVALAIGYFIYRKVIK